MNEHFNFRDTWLTFGWILDHLLAENIARSGNPSRRSLLSSVRN